MKSYLSSGRMGMISKYTVKAKIELYEDVEVVAEDIQEAIFIAKSKLKEDYCLVDTSSITSIEVEQDFIQ